MTAVFPSRRDEVMAWQTGATIYGEKRARQLQNLIGLAQFLDLALQRLEALAFLSRHAIAQAGIDLVLAHPFVQRLRNAADLRGYRLDGCLQ